MFGDLGPTGVLDRSPIEWGAGGLARTARDGLRFLLALFDGKLLPSASIEAMTDFRDTPNLGGPVADGGAPAEGDEYGLGLVRLTRGHTLLGHGVLFTGHTAGMWYWPDCGMTRGTH